MKDGDEFDKSTNIMSITGFVTSILASERAALNFLSFLSGIASTTRKVEQTLSPWGIKVLDTRKTLPGFRLLSKYAVAVGGGLNHRLHLADRGLIKDNHIAACQDQDIREAVLKFRKKYPKMICQVEVNNMNQLESILTNESKPDHVLLDNMSPRLIKKCVKKIKEYSKKSKKKICVEASGGFHLGNIKSIKKTGVDLVSMSSITMDPRPINFSLQI